MQSGYLLRVETSNPGDIENISRLDFCNPAPWRIDRNWIPGNLAGWRIDWNWIPGKLAPWRTDPCCLGCWASGVSFFSRRWLSWICWTCPKWLFLIFYVFFKNGYPSQTTLPASSVSNDPTAKPQTGISLKILWEDCQEALRKLSASSQEAPRRLSVRKLSRSSQRTLRRLSGNSQEAVRTLSRRLSRKLSANSPGSSPESRKLPGSCPESSLKQSRSPMACNSLGSNKSMPLSAKMTKADLILQLPV